MHSITILVHSPESDLCKERARNSQYKNSPSSLLDVQNTCRSPYKVPITVVQSQSKPGCVDKRYENTPKVTI